MRPKLTPWLVIRTFGFLAFFAWGAYMVFRVPGGLLSLRALVGFTLGILCLETMLPLIRSFSMVTERVDFVLAGIQYVVVPSMALLILAGAVVVMFLEGEMNVKSAVKSVTTGVALCAMIGTFVLGTWKKYRRERGRNRQERLEQLDKAYREGIISREVYQDRREAIYESMWKSERS